jgi:hypothetical protein
VISKIVSEEREKRKIEFLFYKSHYIYYNNFYKKGLFMVKDIDEKFSNCMDSIFKDSHFLDALERHHANSEIHKVPAKPNFFELFIIQEKIQDMGRLLIQIGDHEGNITGKFEQRFLYLMLNFIMSGYGQELLDEQKIGKYFKEKFELMKCSSQLLIDIKLFQNDILMGFQSKKDEYSKEMSHKMHHILDLEDQLLGVMKRNGEEESVINLRKYVDLDQIKMKMEEVRESFH